MLCFEIGNSCSVVFSDWEQLQCCVFRLSTLHFLSLSCVQLQCHVFRLSTAAVLCRQIKYSYSVVFSG